MSNNLTIHPIGIVHKDQKKIWIEVYDQYLDALLGLDGFSHIHVLYWFHENDSPERRGTLQVHPRGDHQNPLTGVFATHSPNRPNLIALTICKILSIRGNRIELEDIDAHDKSPVIDIKCYIPHDLPKTSLRVPNWVRSDNKQGR
jgi:tRNA-Thr(GGU) m(6)t(6)A37 methyltransferase TsaA